MRPDQDLEGVRLGVFSAFLQRPPAFRRDLVVCSCQAQTHTLQAGDKAQGACEPAFAWLWCWSAGVYPFDVPRLPIGRGGKA